MKQLKHLLCLLLSVAATIAAHANVAQIGSTEYASLKLAVESAQAGETVTMIDNSTEAEQIAVNKAITIDLNGKTVTCSFYTAINATADLTITDNSQDGDGTIKTSGIGVMVNNAASLTLHKISMEDNSTSGQCVYLLSGNLIIDNDAHLKSSNKAIVSYNSNNSVTLKNGTINGEDTGADITFGSLTMGGGNYFQSFRNSYRV